MFDQKPEPLVSIIVPILNAERYLYSACQAIRSQTYKNWEAILVDDGSSDRSKEIARMYVILDERFRLMDSGRTQDAPRGPWLARNQGLRTARGDYVSFLDADDLWRHDKLSKQLELLRKVNANLCVSTYLRFVDNGGWVSEIRRPPLCLHSWLLEIVNPIPLSSVVVRKEVMAGGFNPVPHEDHDAWKRINLSGSLRYCCLRDPVTAYRIHDRNLTGSWLKKMALHRSATKRQHILRGWISTAAFILLHCRYFVMSVPFRLRRLSVGTFGFDM